MENSEIIVVEELQENFRDLTREELIEEVERKKMECQMLKEKLKYTESFIIEPTTNKNTKQTN